ncbi:MAG: hypothetical protein WD152_03400 [Nitriliruptoraceae bacterium]
MSWVDHDPGSSQVATARTLQRLALSDHRDGSLLMMTVKTRHLGARLRPCDAVHRHADVELKVTYGIGSVVAVDAVVETTIESEQIEPPLKFLHVMAVQGRLRGVEQSVAEAERRADERVPGVVADVSIGSEPVRLLKGSNRGPGAVAEHARVIGARKTDLSQTSLDIFDCRACIAVPDPFHEAGAYAPRQ